MDFFKLMDISHRYLELMNPATPEKVITLGRFLRLREGSRVIDFGCGCAEPLVLWAERFGIRGVGIDISEHACERAREKVAAKGLAGRIEIVHGKGAEYRFPEGAFDAATCIGASFVWDGYQSAIQAMKSAIRKGGRLGVGEPYWRSDRVPPEYAAAVPSVRAEHELLLMAREEGFDFEYVVRSSQDDWDGYEAGNWHGLIRWLEENPDHPEREQVAAHLRRTQDDYLKHGREHLGWAMYVLAPMACPPGQGAGA